MVLLTRYRCKPTVRLHYLTEELAFETIEQTVQFIIDRKGQELIDNDGDHARLKTGSRHWEDQKTKDQVVIDTQGLKGL